MSDDGIRNKLVLNTQLVMPPKLQLAVRLLSMTQDELFAMIADWRDKHPGAIADLEPGDPEPISEQDQAQLEEDGIPIWTFLAAPPLPAASPRAEVWVFGNPPQARANPSAGPRLRAVLDDGTTSRSADDVREAEWLARAVRQRAKTMEGLVAALIRLRPELATTAQPEKVKSVGVKAVADAMGMHETTVARVTPVCRYQTIHGVVQLVMTKRKISHRALW
ncbi:MAG: hypothetical protein WKG01_31375 [Kofleriaceae bacterium]